MSSLFLSPFPSFKTFLLPRMLLRCEGNRKSDKKKIYKKPSTSDSTQLLTLQHHTDIGPCCVSVKGNGVIKLYVKESSLVYILGGESERRAWM